MDRREEGEGEGIDSSSFLDQDTVSKLQSVGADVDKFESLLSSLSDFVHVGVFFVVVVVVVVIVFVVMVLLTVLLLAMLELI